MQLGEEMIRATLGLWIMGRTNRNTVINMFNLLVKFKATHQIEMKPSPLLVLACKYWSKL
jgi:hypothetical protein